MSHYNVTGFTIILFLFYLSYQWIYLFEIIHVLEEEGVFLFTMS